MIIVCAEKILQMSEYRTCTISVEMLVKKDYIMFYIVGKDKN